MITKDYLKKELARRIAGIKPGVPTTTDLAIGEMKSLLVLVEGLEETPLPEDTAIFNQGVAEGRRLEREENQDRDTSFYKGMKYAREMMKEESVAFDIKDGDKVRVYIFKED